MRRREAAANVRVRVAHAIVHVDVTESGVRGIVRVTAPNQRTSATAGHQSPQPIFRFELS